MSDAMRVAQKRRQEYKTSIAEMEKEIAELQELVADLDSFIEFGDALLSNSTEDTAAASHPDAVSDPIQKAPSDRRDAQVKKPTVASVASDTNEQISKALAQRANG